jgi:hypothetical protein
MGPAVTSEAHLEFVGLRMGYISSSRGRRLQAGRSMPSPVLLVNALCLALALTGCAHQSSLAVDSSAHETGSQTHEAAADTVQEQRVERGPVTITTTEEDWAPVSNPSSTALVLDNPGTQDKSQSSVAPAVPATGRLTRRITTVVQRGPVVASSSTVTATRAEEQASQSVVTSTKSVAKDESHPELPRVSCGFGGTIWGLVALALVVGAVLALWKLKKWPFG